MTRLIGSENFFLFDLLKLWIPDIHCGNTGNNGPVLASHLMRLKRKALSWIHDNFFHLIEWTIFHNIVHTPRTISYFEIIPFRHFFWKTRNFFIEIFFIFCIFNIFDNVTRTMVFSANRSPPFVKIISLYLPDDFASWIKKARLAHTLPSLSIARNTRSTGFIEETTCIRNFSSWKLFIPLLSSAWWSLFIITQSSSAPVSDFESSRHSICPGCSGFAYIEVIARVVIYSYD